VDDVMGMMRSFQRMSEVLINHLDRDEDRGSTPNEGLQHPPVSSSSVHKELRKVKFLEFLGSVDDLAADECLENMEGIGELCNYLAPLLS
jgi:hypothetical protein